MKIKSKKKLFIIVLLPLIALGAATMTLQFNKGKNVNKPIDQNDQPNRLVYVMTGNNLLVPLTIPIGMQSDVGQEVLAVVDLLKPSSPVIKKGFTPLIPEATKVNSINIASQLLKIDFSSEFLDYEVSNELALLQGLVYNFTQFEQVDRLQISVDGVALTKMPQKGTPIPLVLDRSIGINNVGTPGVDPYNALSVTVYCKRKIQGIDALVPLTKNIPHEANRVQAYTNQIFNPNCEVLGFSKPDFLTKIKPIATPTISQGELVVNLNQHALEDETAMRPEIYNYIVISFNEMAEVKRVRVLVEGEEVQISGYDVSLNEIQVSNIIYNEVQI